MATEGLDGLGDEIRMIVTEDVRATGLNLITGLIKITPVGNPDLWVYKHPTRGYIDYVGYFGQPDYTGGTARGNWFFGVGSPIRTEDPKRRQTEASSEAVTAANTVDLGDTVYITNNLPYIERLNEGWSTQAPAKFIEKEIIRVTRG